MGLIYKLNLAMSIIVLTGVLTAANAAAQSGEIARGRALYRDHCAVCHGRNGDGKGPMARAMTTPPANLRLLSERYGNPLPTEQIANFIDGRADVAAHGPRDMPIWGSSAWEQEPGGSQPGVVTPAIASLVAYIQSIQISKHHVASVERRTRVE
jgi:mono/diheme cytochrome c family protein